MIDTKYSKLFHNYTRGLISHSDFSKQCASLVLDTTSPIELYLAIKCIMDDNEIDVMIFTYELEKHRCRIIA